MELAATRFMYWFTFFAIDLMLWLVILRTHAHPFSVRKSTSTEVMVLGVAGAGISITLQQWFWWSNEHLRVIGHCSDFDPLIYNADICARQSELYSFANYTMVFYFTAVLFAPLIANVALRLMFPNHWYIAGISFVLAAWGLGYGLTASGLGA